MSRSSPTLLGRLLILGLFALMTAAIVVIPLAKNMSVAYELQLSAPDEVLPGARVPIRAMVLGALDEPSGPRLVQPAVVVTLLGEGAEERSRVSLSESAGGDLYGHLSLPDDLLGSFELFAQAIDGDRVLAESHRSLRIDPEAMQSPLLGRRATSLQVSRASEIVVEEGQVAPSAMDFRVVGGACVPEVPCQLLVYGGVPAAVMSLREGAALRVVAAPTTVLERLTTFSIIVSGPEAQTELWAHREGRPVAHRQLQLPVALATPPIGPAPAMIASASDLPALVFASGTHAIADLFRGGRWVGTFDWSGPDGSTSMSLPAGLSLPTGLLRFQVRGGVLGDAPTAVRRFWVGQPGEPEAHHLSAPPGPTALRWAWALAPEEVMVRQLPRAQSGLAAAEAAHEQARGELELAASFVIGLVFALTGLLFLRRGLSASHQADEVMRASGDPRLNSAGHRRQTLFSAMLVVLASFLALAFVIGLLALKSLLF